MLARVEDTIQPLQYIPGYEIATHKGLEKYQIFDALPGVVLTHLQACYTKNSVEATPLL